MDNDTLFTDFVSLKLVVSKESECQKLSVVSSVPDLKLNRKTCSETSSTVLDDNTVSN